MTEKECLGDSAHMKEMIGLNESDSLRTEAKEYNVSSNSKFKGHSIPIVSLRPGTVSASLYGLPDCS